MIKGTKTFFKCQQAECKVEQRLDKAYDRTGMTCNKCMRVPVAHDKYRNRIYICKTCSNTGRATCFNDLTVPKCKTCAITDGELAKPNERAFNCMLTKREKKALTKDRPQYADPTEKESMAECHTGRVKAIETAIKNLKNLNFGTALEVACGGGQLTKDLLAGMFKHTDMFDRCPAAQRDV